MTEPLFAVLDIEALDWDQYLLACTLDSEGELQRHPNLASLQRWVEKFPGKVFAHVGGRYDFLFLSGLDSVLMTGSTMLRSRCGKATLCDSYPLFLQSLGKIGKAIGFEKQTEFPRERLKEALSSGEVSLKEISDYCARDCAVLMKALKTHRSFCLEEIPHREPKWPSTGGATAVYAAEAFDPKLAGYMAQHGLTFDEWSAHRDTVVGGRCELWQLGPVAGPIYCYDAKSSYPSRYLEGPFPVGPWRYVPHEVSGRSGMWHVRFSQPTDRLPLLTASGIHVHAGEGWATSEEIEVARSELGARVDVIEGWVTDSVAPFGRAFLKSLYALKERGSPFAKPVINSLHGKLGQGILGGMYYLRPDGTYLFCEELTPPRWFQRPLTEAVVYARARIALWRAMDGLRRSGWRVYYTDTDSIHTDCPPERFEVDSKAKLGVEAGDFELQKTASRGLYLAPKAYAHWLPDGKTHVACKGFPSEKVSPELLERAFERPEVVRAPFGLLGFRSGGEAGAKVRNFDRTLSAHPGTSKLRRGDDSVWYRH